VAEVYRGTGAERTDLAGRNPDPPTGGEAYTVLLRLSEKSSNGQTTTIYAVFYANHTPFIAS
jgi:hypothetical protein